MSFLWFINYWIEEAKTGGFASFVFFFFFVSFFSFVNQPKDGFLHVLNNGLKV